MTYHERFLFRRAKARIRSMRNTGVYSQKDYEVGISIIRDLIREGQFTAPILMDR